MNQTNKQTKTNLKERRAMRGSSRWATARAAVQQGEKPFQMTSKRISETRL